MDERDERKQPVAGARGARRRDVVAGAGALTGAWLAAACGVLGGPSGPGTATGGRLVLWPEHSGGQFDVLWPQIDERFRATFPNVEYQREARPTREGVAFLQLLVAAAAAGSVPDVYQDDVVLNRLQVTVPAGIPRAVDEYYARLPNLKRVFPWTRQVAQLRGKLWGIPHEVEFVSVFYNKGAFEKAGVKPGPQTWDDFSRLGQTLKVAGTLPLVAGNLGNYRHLHGYLMAATLGKEGMDDVRAGKGRWDAGGAVDAAQTMLDLSAAGILPLDPLDPAVAYPADFYAGKAAQIAIGTWAIASYEPARRQNQGFEFGQYAIPSPRRGLKPQLCGGVGGGFSITAQAKAPDTGAAFVDFLYSPPIQKLLIESVFHIPPVPFKVEDFDVAPGNREALSLIQQFEQAGIAPAFWMVQTSRQSDEYGPLIERLLKKQITPKELGLRMQQLWDESKPE
jgi:ABC-type glycerol-3-phosphate transport system substrate-binding protein